MTLLDEATVSSDADAARGTPAPDDTTIDLTGETAPSRAAPADASPARAASQTPIIDPSGRMPLRGMRIRRVRLGSVAVVAAVFWVLGYLVTVGTLVALWNVAQSLGFVADVEDALVTSLGLDAFQIDGASLFTVVSIGAAIIAAIGWLLTVLLAAVYNATCALFGGVAVETGPLQRRRRVLSLRHRGLVTVRT